MKAMCCAALAALGTLAALGQEPALAPVNSPSPDAPPAATVPPPDPGAPTPPETTGPPARNPGPLSEPETGAVLSGNVGWSPGGVELRQPATATAGTNRVTPPKGVVTRIARPERKGFSGFLAGFANLFNPFTPAAKGVESRPEYWYDGGINTAPLPRGFQDERSHEPKTDLISIGVEGEPQPAPVQPAP
jgi:hypothetical protein